MLQPSMPRSVAHAVVAAPAKVNLVLRVVGRRADGYHLLESLMVPISLCDTVSIAVSPARNGRTRIGCIVTGPARVTGGAENLAARAASALLDELRVAARVDIRLRKTVPHGAGLGGGSSDAAAVLVTLARLLRRRIRGDRLAALAAGLGADVPFFLRCRPAWATGIGERLQPFALKRLNLVVAVPRRRVETAWAYANVLPSRRRLAARRREEGAGSRYLRALAKSLSCHVSNDFEAGVAAAVPDVARLKRRLEELGAMATVMSGSGSAVVGMFDSRASAEIAAGAFSGPDRAWAVRSLSGRPRPRE